MVFSILLAHPGARAPHYMPPRITNCRRQATIGAFNVKPSTSLPFTSTGKAPPVDMESNPALLSPEFIVAKLIAVASVSMSMFGAATVTVHMRGSTLTASINTKLVIWISFSLIAKNEYLQTHAARVSRWRHVFAKVYPFYDEIAIVNGERGVF
jgi:hypothetical protein